jgi:alpha-beta hydrolase superfamily lysophospholipase
MNDLNNQKRRLPSIFRWIIWVLLVQFILLNISSAIYAYRLTHFYNNTSVNLNTSSSNIFSRTWKLFTGPRQMKPVIKEKPVFPYQDISLKTTDSLIIRGWYSRQDSISKGTVILFHGINANKAFLLDEAYEFRFEGYNVLMVDFRGHGDSEGNTTTIGYRESEEVKLAYDFIRSQGDSNIFLYGVSLGAVVVAKAVSEYGLQPAALILDMPFASLQSYLKNRARSLGFPGQPFAFLTTFWIGLERGFNGYGHKTTRYLEETNCPVLLQWGTLDAFIPRGETEKIFESIRSAEKKYVQYEGSGHESFLRSNPIKWRIEMEKFLAR